MPDLSHHGVAYVTDGWGVHDERWFSALQACDLHPRAYSRAFHGRVGSPATDCVMLPLAQIVEAVAPASGVLAGPLPDVTQPLIEAGLTNIVGLSWGWDLQEGHRRALPDDALSWIRRLRHLIVDSVVTRDRAVRLGLPAERISLIPWGVDLEQFRPTGPIDSLGIDAGTRVLLTLRAHEPPYRTGDVLEAFDLADLDDAVLVVGSDGSMTSAYREWVESRGRADRVHFIGRVDESRLAPILRRADAYVSASETDGTSVTLLQAMACGTPVIASAIPGNLPWIADQPAGWTFPVGDVGTLAELMRQATRDDSAAERAALAGRIVRERADWARNRTQLTSLLAPSS